MIEFVRTQDPDGAEKLENLLKKKEVLMAGNVYGERFTARQFSLVFDPLLKRAVERAHILENLGRSAASVPELARDLDLTPNIVFDHIKELTRRDIVDIAGYNDRDALYRRKYTYQRRRRQRAQNIRGHPDHRCGYCRYGGSAQLR